MKLTLICNINKFDVIISLKQIKLLPSFYFILFLIIIKYNIISKMGNFYYKETFIINVSVNYDFVSLVTTSSTMGKKLI